MLSNSIEHIIYETFSVSVSHTDETSGEVTHNEIALCHQGHKKDVTDENKLDYIRLLVQWKTHYSVSTYLDPFLQAFHEAVPVWVLREAEMQPEELDLVLNGKPSVEVDDLRAYCIYQGGGGYRVDVDNMPLEEGKEREIQGGWGEEHEGVVWLWQALRDMGSDDVRMVLAFFTGSARVPLDGFVVRNDMVYI